MASGANPWWVIGKPSGAAWSGVRVVQGPQSTTGGVRSFGGQLPAGYQVIAGPFGSQAAAAAAAPGGGQGTGSAPVPGAPVSGPAGANGRYTYAQLEQLWINAGGDKALAPLMAAIAEAESGGDPNAHSSTDDWGLWQINRAAWGSLATFDPVANAKAAVHVYQVQGPTAWTTYKTGAYRAFLNGSTTPDPNVPTAPGSGGGGGGGGGNIVLTSTIAPGTCVIPLNIPIAGQFCLLSKGQARGVVGVLLMIGGGMLLLPGLLVLAAAGLEKTGAGTQAAQAAAAVSPLRAIPRGARAGVRAGGERVIGRAERRQAAREEESA